MGSEIGSSTTRQPSPKIRNTSSRLDAGLGGEFVRANDRRVGDDAITYEITDEITHGKSSHFLDSRLCSWSRRNSAGSIFRDRNLAHKKNRNLFTGFKIVGLSKPDKANDG